MTVSSMSICARKDAKIQVPSIPVQAGSQIVPEQAAVPRKDLHSPRNSVQVIRFAKAF